MTDRLHLLLTHFARTHADAKPTDAASSHPVLLVDDRWLVNLIEEPDTGKVRALAHLGALNVSLPTPALDSEWAATERDVNGFAWTIACHIESGALAITATIPRVPDAAAFDDWLARFIDRMRSTGAIWSMGSGPSAKALASTSPDPSTDWLRA